MPPAPFPRLVVLALLAFAPGCVIVVDNDFQDANYTAGYRLQRMLQPADDDWLARGARDLAGGLALFDEPGDREHHVTRVGVSFGQQLYTPEDTARRGLIRDDRPYAGWLFGGLVRHDGFHDDDPTRRRDALVSTSVDFGIVGQGALGEELQVGFHRLVNDDEPEGWGNQLENEPGLLLGLDGRWRLAYGAPVEPRGLGWDVVGRARGRLGNVRSSASAGGELRVGWNLPRAFDAALADGPGPDCACGGHEPGEALYGFLGGDAELVLHDIFLDGNTFTSSHSVDREPLVGSLHAGLALRSGSISLRWALHLISDQFEQQGGSHWYTSLVLAWRPSVKDAAGGP